ncbi:glucose 1-dehydrogenase [Georgenia sp. M64]|uniref:glucose 1-dehydrogenase n=1 Tax=Georgenia sp. M64 TaxID=3120520 RepID=UPI0030E5D519
MGRFEGKVALVSGGARGMGESHVRALAAEGARVVIGDVLDHEGEALAAELGDAAVFVRLDVTDPDSWSAALTRAEEAFGPVTVLVNNAGIVVFGAVDAVSVEDFDRTVAVNLRGVFLGIHAVAPGMKAAGGGTIVNISSTAGLMGYAGIAPYVASKWAVRGLTKASALDLGPTIRVNSIHPGPIATPMTAGLDTSMVETQRIPRFGRPEEVTAAVLFLAGDESSFMTGAELAVDGGAVLGSIAPVT